MPTPQSIENVVFDVGQVLLEWNPPQFISALYPQPELQELFRREMFEHDDWHEFDRGALDFDGAARHFAQRTGRSCEECANLIRVARESLRPIEGTIALLEALAAADLGLYVLSNMPVSTYDYLIERHGFFRYFDHIVISGAIKLNKPDPAIYKHLIDTTGIDPARSLFMDDLPRNVAAARAVGLHAFEFRGPAEARRELANYLPNVFMSH